MSPDAQITEAVASEEAVGDAVERYLHVYRTRTRKLAPPHVSAEARVAVQTVLEALTPAGARAEHARLLLLMLYFGTSLLAEELEGLERSAVEESPEGVVALRVPGRDAETRLVWLDHETAQVLGAYLKRLPPSQRLLLVDPAGKPFTRLGIYQTVASLQDDEDRALEHFFPIYHESDYSILPTPLRLNADTHYTGRGVTIAFIDSGFYPHPDLVQPRNRVRAYVNIAEPDRDDFAFPDEGSWHGMQTSVAAAGNGYLSRGLYRTIAPDADVVLLKVRGRHGIQTRYILDAFEWILAHQEEHNIRIVNISLSGERPGSFLRSVLDQTAEGVVQAGIVVVAAAGNAGWAQGSEVIRPPASAPSVITVGGLNDNNRLDVNAYEMYWSSYGPTMDGILKPEIVAPGIWVAAPLLPGTQVYLEAHWLHRLSLADDGALQERLKEAIDAGMDWPQEWLSLEPARLRAALKERTRMHKLAPPYYQHVDGTSFSAPIVCSVIAQMLQANPSLTPARIKTILTRTTDKLYNVPLHRQGYGLIHPRKAVKEAANDLHRQGVKRQNSPWVRRRRVTFYYRDAQATSVSVAGDFNRWDRRAHPLTCISPGLWSAEVDFDGPDAYAYKFVVDGQRWVTDPENLNREPDGFGGLNARVNILL